MQFNIKKTTLALLLLLSIGIVQVFSQTYVIEMKYADDALQNMQMSLVWHVAPNDCKLQVKNSYEGRNVTSSFYVDKVNSSIKLLEENPTNGKKLFYTVSTSSIQPNVRFNFKGGKAEQTEEVKNIAGVSCKKAIFTTDKFVCEFWLASTLPDIKRWTNFFQSYPELQGMTVANLSGFPLAAEIKDLSGKTLVKSEAVAVTKKEFDEGDFKVPSEYIDASKLERKK